VRTRAVAVADNAYDNVDARDNTDAPSTRAQRTSSPFALLFANRPGVWRRWRGTLRPMAPLAMRLFIKGHVTLYQLTGGKLGGKMSGRDVLLLTTQGRKSGVPRTVPVVPFVDKEKTYVIASMAGAPAHPAWFLNLKTNPVVDVQLGSARWRAHAVELAAADRDAIWSRVTAAMPDFAKYQEKTTRVIPVVRLDRMS
jgi:deazaflavin-dependent oxidoreductase (nitroreductase family)